MTDLDDKLAGALRVARMYYYQNLNTETIAQELQVSRSKVSRLLTYAREHGLVEIRVLDPKEQPRRLEEKLQQRYTLDRINIVSIPENADEQDALNRVVVFAAKYVNNLVESHMTLGVAWGHLVSLIARQLVPKPTTNVHIVQLNGDGMSQSAGVGYASEIILRFADSLQARAHLFPVPAYFDFPETKKALWRERSIRRLLELQERADVYLYSLGSVRSGVPDHAHAAGFLESRDFAELETQNVVGDLATRFFRADGSNGDLPINTRASGPDLELYHRAGRSLCVICGESRLPALRGALRGGFISDLVLDEPTARLLLESPEPVPELAGAAD